MPFCADLFYREYGGNSGKFTYPVILLHGVGGSHLGWPVALRRLPGERVYALDLPGHGRSEGPACTDLIELCNCLYAFIQEMGFYHVVLVGYSLGGALAFHYTALNPQRVAGLAVISCGNFFMIPPELFSTLRDPPRIGESLEIFNRVAFHSDYPQRSRREILQPMGIMNATILRLDFTICGNFHSRDIKGPIPCPSLIIGGQNDRIIPAASLRQLAEKLPASTLHFVPHAGHMLVFEQTETLREILTKFLKSCTAPWNSYMYSRS